MEKTGLRAPCRFGIVLASTCSLLRSADEAESGSDGFVCKGGCVDDIGLSMPNGRRYDSLSVVGSCCSCPISSLAAACPSANQTKLNQLCDIAGDIGNAASADLWQPMLVDIQKFSVVEAQFA